MSELPTELGDDKDDLRQDILGLGSDLRRQRLLPGTVLGGRYRILKLAGTGGQATTYRAYDVSAQCDVAVKMVDSERHQQAKALLADGKINNYLRRSEWVIPIIDAGEDNVGGKTIYYLIRVWMPRTGMDLIENQIDWHPIDNRRQNLRIVLDLVDAVAYLHQLQPPIFHRDIKPANLLIDDNHRAYLSDFGIAVLLNRPLEPYEYFRGTDGYRPPIQAPLLEGNRDLRSEVYALGRTILEIVLGRKLQHTETVQLNGELVALGFVLERATSLNPANRHATAEELREELRRAVEPLLLERSTAWWSRPRTLAVVALGVALLATVWGLWWVGLFSSPTPTGSVLVPNSAIEPTPPKTNEPKANEPKANEPKTNEPKTNEPKTNEPKTNEPAKLEALLLRRARWASRELRPTPGGTSRDPSELAWLSLVGPAGGQEGSDTLRVATDGFRLEGQFASPACWCLVWIDTAGVVEVHAPAESAQANWVYPSLGRWELINSADPAGRHLLAVVSSSELLHTEPRRADLRKRLSDLGVPPGPRGSGGAIAGESELPADYLERFRQRLPADCRLARGVWLTGQR